jgi:two-component system cell cycle sensor histidine kinase/response regulator CckA
MNLSPDIADHRERILIVDDERSNRDLLEVMLEPEGFVVETAASGEEALAMVAREPPDLILLDIMMPGMDGYKVAGEIKGNPATRNIRVIMITALDDRDARLLGLGAGVEDFLSKPVDRAELCVRVKNLLRLKAFGDYCGKYTLMLEDEVASRTADLVESERLYRSTFDAAPVGIVHVGLDGHWLRVNQRLCVLLGYSREELQSPAVHELLQSEEAPGEGESLRQMAAGTLHRYVVDEKRYRRRDGSSVWARVNMSVHRDAAGQSQHFISVIEDITERRVLEAQVRQASKMDAIGRLASGVAHDFNNLLTVILGFAEIIADDTAVADRHVKDLGEIVKAAQRASGLTRQLLAFSRQQLLHAVPLDVNGLITEMTGMLGRLIGEHIKVTLALAPHLSLALADRGQLEQVVMNLVVNARDAMPDGGTLTIETTDVELEDSSLRDEAMIPGRYVMLAITDTGNGMTKETQRRLFEPFFTTKETGKGTGLGLSTTYGIVKQSKGYIWVYSEPGSGTTFKVYLPHSSADAAVRATSPRVTAAVKGTSETVLLVEDEAGVRKLSKRILDNAGYQVLEAANGDDAERLFAQHADSIDLVVTDVIMPGCGGPELLSRLKVQAPAVRVLYMSGYTEQSAAHKAGFDLGLPFVQKPFTAAEFVRQVREALDR